MILNQKFEIFPTEEQQQVLTRWLFLCRHTYNSSLLDRSNAYKLHRKSINRHDLQRIQTSDKKIHTFLKEIPSQPLQEVLFRLEKAFNKFFRKEARYPKLKKERDYNSLTFTQFGITTQRNKKTGKVQIVRKAASLGTKGQLLISKLGLIPVMCRMYSERKIF